VPGDPVTTPRPTKGVARPIRYVGDPVLRTPTDEVVEFDESLARLVEDMFASMYAAEGVGLAANQIGIARSVFVYDCPDESGRRHVGHVVNPVLVSTGGDQDTDIEGCLSVPDLHYENVRASYAAVEGVDVTGAPVRVVGDGVLARCLQHEADHLHGLLFLDRLRGRTKRKAMREVMATDFTELSRQSGRQPG
jgi:peptide deformylase